VLIYGIYTKLGCSRISLILLLRKVIYINVQERAYPFMWYLILFILGALGVST